MKRILTAWPALALLAAFCVAPVASAATPTAEEVAKLVASDGATDDRFGWSVALDGDTAVIAAISDDDKGTDSGSAYVFTRAAGVWTQQAKLVASDGAALDRFGYSVALDGDTAVIGAYGDDDKGTNSGSAYVFTRAAGAWTEQAKLLASDGAATDWFGFSVALDGDTAVIAAISDDDKGTDSGSAYVFTRAAGVWTQQAKLVASDGAALDQFGWSVALDGDTAVIGARLDDDKGIDSGSAYVFTRAAGAWTEQAKLVASDGATNDQFGFAVALDGDTAVIGAYLDDDKGTNSGSAYVFTRAAGAWSETLKLLASDGKAQDWLGYFYGAVDISGGAVLAGAGRHDLADPVRTDAGAAYVFSVITDDEGPITSNVVATPNPVAINTTFVITATVDDTTTGNSAIASAAYTVNGAGPYSMDASDGAFDSPVENVTATVAGLDVGVYDICVSGTDAAGNIGAAECTMLAVYDPTAGFVSGGGWIQSPEGAYLADTSLSGKANFGFVSRYKKGANVPDGNTQFVFHAGELSFHSSSYEWLVVAGGKAQFKGVGTINGAGNYGFIIFATDAESTSDPADVDSFRIQIWDRDNADAPVYDNGVEQALGGGSIVVHTGGKK